MNETREIPQGLKLALDFAPLIAFFAAYKLAGMYWATGIIIALTLISVAIGFALTGRVAKFPLFGAILITVMGGLTLYLQNDTFVKMKPTAANLLFVAVLTGGLFSDRLFLKDMLGTAMELPDKAWRVLTWRWAWFFAALAVLNEFVWRNFSEGTWVNFKVFGLMGLTLAFAAVNAPFMMRNMQAELAGHARPGTKPDKPSVNG
jgi:intracellular septation protein